MVFFVYVGPGLTSLILHMFAWPRLENEIADYWIERDTRERCRGKSCCTRRMDIVRFFCWSTFLLFISIILLIVLWYVLFTYGPPVHGNPNKPFDGTGIHMFIWPLVGVIISIGLLFLIACTCGCKYTCKLQPPQEVKVMAATLHQHGVYTLMQLNPEERQRILRECAPAPEPEEEHNAEVV